MKGQDSIADLENEIHFQQRAGVWEEIVKDKSLNNEDTGAHRD
jgi:hypothetical protein